VRLLRRRDPHPGDAARAITQAVSAGAEASERLVSASEVRAETDAQVAHERQTIVSEIRAMRERNHLADVIIGSVRGGDR